MALAEFLAELDELAAAGQAAFAAASDAAALEAARVEFLGAKSGRIKNVQKGLGGVAGPDKPAAGKRFNDVKTALEAGLAAAEATVREAQNASDALRNRIVEIPATTLTGLIFKARYAAKHDCEPDVVTSIVNDLLAIGEATNV